MQVLSSLKKWLKEVAASKVLTLFEPEIQSIPDVYIGQARYISTKLLKAADNDFIIFPKKYGRHTTLAGIWMFLSKDHHREYLITAFGRRKGVGLKRPAQFDGLHISYGSSNQVQFSPSCIDYFQKHISCINNAEVLICHNHQRNIITDILSQIMDWNPLPSNTDRNIVLNFKYNDIVRWLSTGNFQNVRFFLVERSRLQEICLPPAKFIVRLFNVLK